MTYWSTWSGGLCPMPRCKIWVVSPRRGHLTIHDGYQDHSAWFAQADAVLSTGSTIANGSIVDILHHAKTLKKDLYFYGTTIAGAAHLLKLNRLCFESY